MWLPIAVYRFVRVIRVPARAGARPRVYPVCPVCVPAPPVSFYRYSQTQACLPAGTTVWLWEFRLLAGSRGSVKRYHPMREMEGGYLPIGVPQHEHVSPPTYLSEGLPGTG